MANVINTKIVGVTYGDRQEQLKECYKSQDLLVKNKPSKNYPHAMAVFTLSDDDDPTDVDKPRKTDHLLGYIADELAKELYDKSMQYVYDDEKPEPYDAWISELTGGTEDKPALGCNIEIAIN